MDTNAMLSKLHSLAANDEKLRKRLLDTRNADDPLESFCAIAKEVGCPVEVGDIFVLNQTLCDNLLKSTNGGATYPIDDWADAYEMFIAGL